MCKIPTQRENYISISKQCKAYSVRNSRTGCNNRKFLANTFYTRTVQDSGFSCLCRNIKSSNRRFAGTTSGWGAMTRPNKQWEAAACEGRTATFLSVSLHGAQLWDSVSAPVLQEAEEQPPVCCAAGCEVPSITDRQNRHPSAPQRHRQADLNNNLLFRSRLVQSDYCLFCIWSHQIFLSIKQHLQYDAAGVKRRGWCMLDVLKTALNSGVQRQDQTGCDRTVNHLPALTLPQTRASIALSSCQVETAGFRALHKLLNDATLVASSESCEGKWFYLFIFSNHPGSNLGYTDMNLKGTSWNA